MFDSIYQKIKKNSFLPTATTFSKNWASTDDEATYKKNLEIQPADWPYRTKSVTYTVNSENYRTKEFKDIDWSNSIVIFGCSHVLGIGLDDKDIISSQLENILDIPVINMGVSGSSMLFNFHNLLILRDGYPAPLAVVMIWPTYNRIVEYTQKKLTHHGAWNLGENMLLDAYNQDNNAKINSVFISKASSILWNGRSKFYQSSWDEDTSRILNCDKLPKIGQELDKFYRPADYARDMRHFGAETAQATAKIIAKKLKL